MEFFSSYIKMLLSVGLCAFICSTICENFKNSKTLERAMATTISICMFITILLPICSIIKNQSRAMQTIEKDAYIETSSFTENIEQAMSKQISGSIEDRLGSSPIMTSVSISSEDGDYNVDEIHIELSKEDIEKKHSVAELLKSMTDSETNIQITETLK